MLILQSHYYCNNTGLIYKLKIMLQSHNLGANPDKAPWPSVKTAYFNESFHKILATRKPDSSPVWNHHLAIKPFNQSTKIIAIYNATPDVTSTLTCNMAIPENC